VLVDVVVMCVVAKFCPSTVACEGLPSTFKTLVGDKRYVATGELGDRVHASIVPICHAGSLAQSGIILLRNVVLPFRGASFYL
jgi:hypothetical protein